MNPTKKIIEWYREHGRDLPWRQTKDPYRIWISEIILQQTRVGQGRDYYLRFIARFPTVFVLASAQEDEVMKYWEGLGYYSRARNLHYTAKILVEKHGGNFPTHYKELLKLKGIGPYTARAIGSIAFGNQTGVLDGNVFRVASRYLADASPIDLPETRRKYQQIVDEWVKDTDAATFNQGIMDLGALVCTPKQPACSQCPIVYGCEAYKEGQVLSFPVKQKKLQRKTRYFDFYLQLNEEGLLGIRKRPLKGFWAGLWEIPNVEVGKREWVTSMGSNKAYLGMLKHVFTHFDMMIAVYKMPPPSKAGGEGRFIKISETADYAFPRALLKIFEQFLPEIL